MVDEFEVCKLCGKSAKLCDSHIIPEFLFTPLYDEKHRYNLLSLVGRKDESRQKGLREKLLCGRCEKQISQYESYAAKMMRGQFGHKFQIVRDKIYLKGIDYSSFKLFQMSILWRVSVSRLDFFKLIDLGNREEAIREMLVNEDPGEPEEFGCVVVFQHDAGSSMTDTMFNPEPVRWAGRRMNKLYFGGAIWLFHCDSRPPVPHLKKFMLKADGTFVGLYGDINQVSKAVANAKMLAKEWGYL